MIVTAALHNDEGYQHTLSAMKADPQSRVAGGFFLLRLKFEGDSEGYGWGGILFGQPDQRVLDERHWKLQPDNLVTRFVFRDGAWLEENVSPCSSSDQILKLIEIRLLEACLLAVDYQEHHGDVPEMERISRLADKAIHVCLTVSQTATEAL